MSAVQKSKKDAPVAKHEEHGYEFLGPYVCDPHLANRSLTDHSPGAFVITFGLPIVCYLMTFLCNDISGCPAPSLLHPSTFTLARLKEEAGWPTNGIWGLASFETTGWVLAYYLLSLTLYRVLPGTELEGLPLAIGGKHMYKCNSTYKIQLSCGGSILTTLAFTSTLTTFALLLAGTIAQGADFPVWRYMWDHHLEILTVNIIISYTLATYVYIKSFSVKPNNTEKRELAAGGISGNMLYDWFIGRELNPRVTLPLFGEIDIKVFNELRPGMMGWLILNFSNIAHQYRTYGFVTDSIILLTSFQTLYVLDAFYMEPAMLTTMDITTDGFGFMLAFGDLVWLPFTYSIQTRYLSVYPTSLGPYGIAAVLLPLAIGYYIFRSSNNEKNRFRNNPNDPRVAHLKALETASGSKLLISGWWGTARHINYFGDWIQSWSYVLPTCLAGYVIQRTSALPDAGAHAMYVDGFPTGYEAVPGEAKGWGMIVTYFYIVYFAVLLVHRELRDEEKCHRKYGADWLKYQKLVPSRIVPGIY